MKGCQDMDSQIEKMRTYFNGLDTAQQKEFINKLKVKLQEVNNPEYTGFLNDCIQKYDSAVKSISADEGAETASSTQIPMNKIRGRTSPSVCFHCGESVMPT